MGRGGSSPPCPTVGSAHDDEATLLMVTLCVLHDVEAKEKGEVTAVEEHGKALKAIDLDKLHAQVHLGGVCDKQE